MSMKRKHACPLKGLALLAAFLVLPGSSLTAQFNTVINVPPDKAPFSIGSDTQLNIFDSGIVLDLIAGNPDGSSENIEINLFSGRIGDGFSDIQTSGRDLEANGGCTVNIEGGLVLGGFDCNGGSIVNLSGGAIRDSIDIEDNAVFNMSGGFAGESGISFNSCCVLDGGTFNMRGGSVAQNFVAWSGGAVNLFGGEFRVNGQPASGLTEVEDRDC